MSCLIKKNRCKEKDTFNISDEQRLNCGSETSVVSQYYSAVDIQSQDSKCIGTV